jgi:tetratricopeptide (TPR) repeat protein
MHRQRFIDRSNLLRCIAYCSAIILLSTATGLSQSSSSAPPAAAKAPQANSAEKPAFDDEPHFSVSGVKDTSALGGHGSDTVVRTRDSLAKDTASLSKSDAAKSPNDSAIALESLRQRAEREPQNAATYHMLADAEERSGDSLAAVREYQRAAELEPREDYLFDWGSELLLHHAPEPAMEVFTRGHRLAPKSARMLIGLGASEFTLGDYDQAAAYVSQASDLNPSDPAPYLFLGKMLAAEAAPSDALTEKLRRFVSLQPDSSDANYYFALALWKRRKDSPEATAPRIESLLNRAIQLDPKYSAAYVQRGVVRSEQGDDAKAIIDYQKAIGLDSQMHDSQMRDSQTHDSQTEEAHYRLAQAYRRLGAEDKAKTEITIYQDLMKKSEQEAERERHEIRQFVYTLRDQPPHTP